MFVKKTKSWVNCRDNRKGKHIFALKICNTKGVISPVFQLKYGGNGSIIVLKLMVQAALRGMGKMDRRAFSMDYKGITEPEYVFSCFVSNELQAQVVVWEGYLQPLMEFMQDYSGAKESLPYLWNRARIEISENPLEITKPQLQYKGLRNFSLKTVKNSEQIKYSYAFPVIEEVKIQLEKLFLLAAVKNGQVFCERV